MSKLTVGSLFAGIGGFDLGLERAGMQVKWQVEIEPYAQRVLAKHWPRVTRYGDIRAIDWADVEATDVVCGGFPCQPHALAGKRKASSDKRDLWGEFVRAIRGVRPRWIVAENVPGLLSSESGRFFGRVLRDLAESGYIAEWDSLPASAFGAPHKRDRVWIVAYPHSGIVAIEPGQAGRRQLGAGGDASNSYADHVQRVRPRGHDSQDWQEQVARPAGLFHGARIDRAWPIEPNVGRVGHGIPHRVDRLRGLGNAIVPQIAEWLGRRILDAEAERLTA